MEFSRSEGGFQMTERVNDPLFPYSHSKFKIPDSIFRHRFRDYSRIRLFLIVLSGFKADFLRSFHFRLVKRIYFKGSGEVDGKDMKECRKVAET